MKSENSKKSSLKALAQTKISDIIFVTIILCIMFWIIGISCEISIVGNSSESGIIRIWIFGLLISMGLGNIITKIVIDHIKSTMPDPDKRGKFTPLLGTIESLAYTVAWVANQFTFIFVWLGLKMAGRWKDKGGDNKPGEINSFLIGNLLTVIFSVLSGMVIKYLLKYS